MGVLTNPVLVAHIRDDEPIIRAILPTNGERRRASSAGADNQNYHAVAMGSARARARLFVARASSPSPRYFMPSRRTSACCASVVAAAVNLHARATAADGCSCCVGGDDTKPARRGRRAPRTSTEQARDDAARREDEPRPVAAARCSALRQPCCTGTATTTTDDPCADRRRRRTMRCRRHRRADQDPIGSTAAHARDRARSIAAFDVVVQRALTSLSGHQLCSKHTHRVAGAQSDGFSRATSHPARGGRARARTDAGARISSRSSASSPLARHPRGLRAPLSRIHELAQDANVTEAAIRMRSVPGRAPSPSARAPARWPERPIAAARCGTKRAGGRRRRTVRRPFMMAAPLRRCEARVGGCSGTARSVAETVGVNAAGVNTGLRARRIARARARSSHRRGRLRKAMLREGGIGGHGGRRRRTVPKYAFLAGCDACRLLLEYQAARPRRRALASRRLARWA